MGRVKCLRDYFSNNNLFFKDFGSTNTRIRNFQNSSQIKTSPAKRPLLSLPSSVLDSCSVWAWKKEETPWQGCWTEVSKLPWCSSSSQLPWINCPKTANLVSADQLSYFAQTNRISGHPFSKILLFWDCLWGNLELYFGYYKYSEFETPSSQSLSLIGNAPANSTDFQIQLEIPQGENPQQKGRWGS